MKSGGCSNEFAERMKKALEMVPGGMDAKAKALGTTSASLYSYINGKSLPQTPFLMKLKEESGVSLDWLFSGEGAGAEAGLNPGKIDLDCWHTVFQFLHRIVHVSFQGNVYFFTDDNQSKEAFQGVADEENAVYISLRLFESLVAVTCNSGAEIYAKEGERGLLKEMQKNLDYLKIAIFSFAYKKMPPMDIDLSESSFTQIEDMKIIKRMLPPGEAIDDLLPNLIKDVAE